MADLYTSQSARRETGDFDPPGVAEYPKVQQAMTPAKGPGGRPNRMNNTTSPSQPTDKRK
jgi:hypothetical protein